MVISKSKKAFLVVTLGLLSVVNRPTFAQTATTQSRTLSQYRATADAYLKTNSKRATQIAKIPETNPTVTIKNKDGSTQQILLMGQDWIKKMLGASLTYVHSVENQRSIYTLLYNKLSATKRTSLKLPTTDAVITKSATEILALNIIILKDLGLKSSVSTDTAPAGYPGDACDTEIGYEDGSDCMYSSGNFCSDYFSTYPWSSNGLYSRFSFPLKYDLTCVKSQGSRGTCASFAVTAAIEAEATKQFGEWYNLSEQYLYWYYKKHIVAVDDNSADGASAYDMLVEAATNVVAHRKESQWNYNPSFSRSTDASDNYVDSCIDYSGEKCTDTVHQGLITPLITTETIMLNGGVQPTNATAPTYSTTSPKMSIVRNAINYETGFISTGATELWDETDPDTSLKLAAAYLSEEHPVVAGILVTDQFDAPNTDGYVSYVSGDRDTSRGSHYVLLVGFITSADLFPTFPMLQQASTTKTGGGYFIIKNSWGILFGDRGYVYVPYNWAKENFIALSLLPEGLTEVDASSAPDSFLNDWKE